MFLYQSSLNPEKIYRFINTPVRDLDDQQSIQYHESAAAIKSIIESINK